VAKRISPVEAVSRRRIQRQSCILLEAFCGLPQKRVGAVGGSVLAASLRFGTVSVIGFSSTNPSRVNQRAIVNTKEVDL
jgi:hypothetical protein